VDEGMAAARQVVGSGRGFREILPAFLLAWNELLGRIKPLVRNAQIPVFWVSR